MRGLGVLKNILVPDTKLTSVLRVGFLSSRLASYKLFSVDPTAITGPQKMGLLLQFRGPYGGN